ncbi:TagA domain-containing protein [Pseudomonas sp. S36]|uniref:TagA domain-containing protein n=1 Tax=Pseudomonas sp. S36 TaxID=2767447 RepID=UPI0019126A63|nr:TagA domain-containing protein [Pseudomonas sp. S36]MBK4991289.1 hypothetical protein [Pseudomonas sp. S36]
MIACSISRLARCLTIAGASLLAWPAAAQDNLQPAPTVRNDLQGPLAGEVDFAQTHVVAATRRIFDPLLVPDKSALVMFRPHASITDVELVIEADGKRSTVLMSRPEALPAAATYDQENTFSGNIIEGNYPPYRSGTFSYQIPWNLFRPETKLSFQQAGRADMNGTLPASKFVFMTPESNGLALMNIKGCIFKDQSNCKTTLDQFDGELQPLTARIAAREMLSELPTQRLYLGTGMAYWPNIIAIGPDGKPHVYNQSNGMQWAEFGDKTLPSKVGMGNYWRAASNLGDKKPGFPVAITGQLLDAPDGMPVLPPGIAASCGGNSCNYPAIPDGYWHETGHGLGLPHDTPGRYEDWAYRAYDNIFLPNTHPDPQRYSLPVDYLGKHYFGHVLGSLAAAPWHPSTASAPLIDEFETLGQGSRRSSWKRYIAPYTHQQTLVVQRRFGTLPDNLEYAGVRDDHRPAQAANAAITATTSALAAREEVSLDNGIAPSAQPALLTTHGAEPEPIETGVPVHTLVTTFSSPDHNQDGINQIYPAIISNFGNVFSPATTTTLSASTNAIDSTAHRLVTYGGRCLAAQGTRLVLQGCADGSSALQVERVAPANADETKLAPVLVIRNSTGQCLDYSLTFRTCEVSDTQVRWRGREDLTGSPQAVKLQEGQRGLFITPTGADGVELMADSNGNALDHLQPGEDQAPHNYRIDIHYSDNKIESHPLYHGPMRKDSLRTAVFNVSSGREPVKAVLKVDDITVQERALERNTLPGVIAIGAEHGEQIPQAWPPSWLYSDEKSACLAATADGIKYTACDAQAVWRLPKRNAYPKQFDSFEPVSITGRCINVALRTDECRFPANDTLWWTREDLDHGPTEIYLQENKTGRFITPSGGSDTPTLAPLQENQKLRKIPISRFALCQQNKCMATVGNKAALITGYQGGPLKMWYLVSTSSTPFPFMKSTFLMMNADGQCLNDQLQLQHCSDSQSQKLLWRANSPSFWSAKMAIQHDANGLFLTAHPSGTLSLQQRDENTEPDFSYKLLP